MHGVEASGGSRYSLVLWLSDCEESVQRRAAPWLKGAADAGSAYAQFLYGEFCKAGSYGVDKDTVTGVEYQQRAAEQGHALSQHQLGTLYWGGRASCGIEQSNEKCLAHWTAAAWAGLASAQVSLAMCYASGYLGLARDDNEARRWFERAARQGHAEAAAVLKRGPPYEL